MKQVEHLLGYRASIKVMDATLRDGGLVNDFYFTDDFVKALYKTIWKRALTIWKWDTVLPRKYLMKQNSVSGNSAVMTISGKS